MDKSNNKRRILALIEILRKQTNQNKRLKLDEIVTKLNELGIEINNRKTLYDDFKILNEFNINVEYDNGYYLLDAPFNLSEIKIIIDSINSLKNLDNRLSSSLTNKLYSFVSNDEVKQLENIKYLNKHKDAKLLEHMEDILEAINNNHSILISTINNKEFTEIYPLFLHRENDYYYFYYHYPNSNKLYHYRFDNVKDIKLLNNKDNINITRNSIINTIQESSNSFSKNNSELINIKLLNDNDRLVNNFLDDFPTAIRTKDGFSIKSDINNNFFSKLVLYGDNIKIFNKDIAYKYKEYLKSVVSMY